MKSEAFDPGDLETLKTLANLYFKVGLYDSSVRTLRLMQVFCPRDPWTMGMLARCFDRQGRYDRVVELTDDLSFCEQEPSIGRALAFLRARCLLKIGREEESRSLIRELLSLKDPS